MLSRPRWVACCLGFSLVFFGVGAHAATTVDVSGGIQSYREFELQNGLRVVLAVDRRVPQVALHIEYAVGEALDPPHQRGLARLIGAMLPRLDTRHVRFSERRRLLEAAGFKFEEPALMVGADTTSVGLQVPAEALELALWLEADRMAYAADVVTNSVVGKYAAAAAEAVDNDRLQNSPFRAALGFGHPYGALDRPSQLNDVSAANVAARLRRFYNPASAVLVLVGDLDPAAAEQAIRRLFAPLPSAPVQPLATATPRGAPGGVTWASASAKPLDEQIWQSPRYFAPDDQGLDVVATVLTRRLTSRQLCEEVNVMQRSRDLVSLFVATCEGPKADPKLWRAALREELQALADGRVPSAQIEGAALHYAVIMGERFDDLLGRAQYIARSVLGGQGAQAVPNALSNYLQMDATQVAAIVRRTLLRAPDGQVQRVRPAAAQTDANYAGRATEAMFQVQPEALAALATPNIDWPRPPANGAAHRFEPPTGLSDSLANGDAFRFVEHGGVATAHVQVQIRWPQGALNPALRPTLAELIQRAPVNGMTLQRRLELIGVDLECKGLVDYLELSLIAPASKVPEALTVLAAVLASKELPQAELAAAKDSLGEWKKRTLDEWDWYWDALGLSSPKTRYEYHTPAEREHAVSQVNQNAIAALWSVMTQAPRAISLVGPFDAATARALGATLSRPKAASSRARSRPERARFRPGVYIIDRGADAALDGKDAPLVNGCVLWPVPRWATPGYYPAGLMPWFFRQDIKDGLSARLAAHSGQVGIWQSNTLLNQDQDFLRYSFRVRIEDVAPVLQSLKEHLAWLAEGNFSRADFAAAVSAERQFQVRQSLSGRRLTDGLGRAADHDSETNQAFDLALQLDRLSYQRFSELPKSLSLEGAIIGFTGPAAGLTTSLKSLGLKPAKIVPLDKPTEPKTEGVRP